MDIKLVSDINLVESEIISNSREKWGDSDIFLRKFLPQLDLAAIAKDGTYLIGFSLAKTIITADYIAVAFFATRILAGYRNKGVAKSLIKNICSRLILREKFLKISNIFKPVYFVSITANPIVFEVMSKSLKAAPSLTRPNPEQIEMEIAEKFAGIFAPDNKFNRDTFVLEQAFLNSVEYYGNIDAIPWSRNQATNEFLEERIKLKNKSGNGLVFVGRIW